MMNYTKKGISIISIFILFFVLLEEGSLAIDVPANIKIGLYFANTAATSIEIGAQSGLQIGFEQDGRFIHLRSEPLLKKVIIRKDSFYNASGVEISGSQGASAGSFYGPYHIKIGQDFESYDAAMQEAAFLSAKGLKVFPAIVNSTFNVWTGLYTSKAEADVALPQIRNMAEGCECNVILPSTTRIIGLLTGKDDVQFVYDGNQGFLCLLPISGNEAAPEAASAAQLASVVSVNGINYRGGVEFKRISSSDMTVINFVDLEQYLYGVLPKEMGANWPLEALKVQAVVARTYAVLNLDKYKQYGFNLCTTTLSQVYGGYQVEQSSCTKAVEETRGRILIYNGSPAQTYYFSSSGGHTEDSQNVWGGVVPYLKGVEDSYEPTDKIDKGIWSVQLTSQKIAELLKAQGYDLGEILSVVPLQYSDAGRVIQLKVTGTKGEKVFEREKTRIVFGANIIYSQCYTINTDQDLYVKTNNENAIPVSWMQMKFLSAKGVMSTDTLTQGIFLAGVGGVKNFSGIPKVYIFNGRGYGHGVGLSQWGAWGMANAGFNYDQILTHYFPGTQIQ